MWRNKNGVTKCAAASTRQSLLAPYSLVRRGRQMSLYHFAAAASRWRRASRPGSLPTWHSARPTSQSATRSQIAGPLTGG